MSKLVLVPPFALASVIAITSLTTVAPPLQNAPAPVTRPVAEPTRAQPDGGAAATKRPEPIPPTPVVPPPQITRPGTLPPPVIDATVLLPGGSRWTAHAPLPLDPQTFTWKTFMSRDAPGSILGLHVYAPRRDPDMVMGTVRWSNGSVTPDGKRFCGGVYYDSFTLTATPGWEWVILPAKGQAVQGGTWVVVAKPAQGDNFARPREMMEFAYALVPAGNAAAKLKAQDALRYKGLVIPSPFLSYGPTHTTLPTVDRAKFATVCAGWDNQLLSGQAAGTKVYIENIANFENEQIGPHWMDGQPAAYGFGGDGIDPTATFAEQVPEGVLAHAIMHRATVSRTFLAAFNIDTGRPITLYEWKLPPNPQLMSGEPGHESEVEIPQFLIGDYYSYRYPRFNTGTCAYEFGHTATINGAAVWLPGIWDYYGSDIAHSVRTMRHALALVEYANDPAARDILLLVSELNRYGWFSDRPDEVTPKKNPGLGYYPSTLMYMREIIGSNPKQGGWFDRNWAWSAFAGACGIEYEQDSARKASRVAWGTHMLEARVAAADKFGFSGRYSSDGNMPAGVSGIQTFHEMLVICHSATLAAQVYGSVPPAIAATNRTALLSALTSLPARAYDAAVGPPHWIGTANNNIELAALTDAFAYGEGDPAHIYSACALTYRADATHPEVLNLALNEWHPMPDLPAMWNFCKSAFPNKAWTVEMESVLEQKLGAH